MTSSCSAAGPAHGPGGSSAWDGVTLGDWAKELDGCDAVINLAGRSVNCRYTAANRREILDSRVLSTRVVGAGDRDGRASPARLAAGEHGDDLRAPLRRAER